MAGEDIVKDIERRMEAALQTTGQELATLRTGRASAALLDPIHVEAYGTRTALRELAKISIPDGRTIVIQPWDPSILAGIEKAILKSDIGLTPNSDGKVIRLTIPALSEERRRELAKVARKIVEEGRVSVRNVRRDGNERIKKEEKAGTIPEDQSRRLQDQVQKMTDGYIKRLDELLQNKEHEIMNF